MPDDPVPEDLLESSDPTLLNKWLSLFVMETRRMDGKRFPSTSLDCLLLRHTHETNLFASNFLAENDPHYAGLRGTRDTVAHQLRADGVGACVKHAEVFSGEQEQLQWESGVMGVDDPRALANAVFFVNGKNLCLRGGCEDHQLKRSQFQFEDDYVEYTENGSKNRSGSYKDKRENKVIAHYVDPSLNERCYVSLLKLYVSKLPPEARSKSTCAFHPQPKEKKPVVASQPRFKCTTRGRNTLATLVKCMCEKAGITGRTNHSLQATGAT